MQEEDPEDDEEDDDDDDETGDKKSGVTYHDEMAKKRTIGTVSEKHLAKKQRLNSNDSSAGSHIVDEVDAEELQDVKKSVVPGNTLKMDHPKRSNINGNHLNRGIFKARPTFQFLE